MRMLGRWLVGGVERHGENQQRPCQIVYKIVYYNKTPRCVPDCLRAAPANILRADAPSLSRRGAGPP